MNGECCVKCGRGIKGAPSITDEGDLLCVPCGRVYELQCSGALRDLTDWVREQQRDKMRVTLNEE